ncbi:MAG: RNA methyltransferase [Sphingomonadales bacterium]|nr:RNA methyltransferase [Sphingomonadales bacterium]
MFMKHISSLQNPAVKETLQLLEKSRLRKSQGLFVAEGLNELKMCLKAGYRFQKLFFCEHDIAAEALLEWFSPHNTEADLYAVSAEVMNKLAYRSGVKNAVAVVESKNASWQQPIKSETPFYLIAESVEKPGNLGALLRSADASGTTAVILCDPAVDIYNPNVIRSSVGCVFSVPVMVMSPQETLVFLQKNNVAVYTTFMEKSVSIWDCDLTRPSAVVVGTESTGLSNFWKSAGTNVNIPMFGNVDSLNVSAAAALMMFEMARQRHQLGGASE